MKLTKRLGLELLEELNGELLAVQALTNRPGSQRESGRNCCTDSYRAAPPAPETASTATLAAAMLNQPAPIPKRVLPLPPKRQPPCHPHNETDQTITNLDRWHLEIDRR